MNESPAILIAPLNWGLGHATRCIPIIRTLRELGANVHLGSDGAALALLRDEFPELPSHELPSYNIRYQSEHLVYAMGMQVPGIWRAIQKEYRYTRNLIHTHRISGIISDNRYGCRSPLVPSVLVCHQINIRLPYRPLELFIRRYHRKLIRRFDDCWIPDFEEPPGLAGELSHNHGLRDATYLGPLSRFQRSESPVRYDIAAVVSGPEPQRTVFETLLEQQLKTLPYKSVLVCGKPGSTDKVRESGNLKKIPFLNSADLNRILLESKMVVCRPGYSSLMDLVALQKKALVIPTPGQTEQEYLATQFSQLPGYLSCLQSETNLQRDLPLLEKQKISSLNPDSENPDLSGILKDWLTGSMNPHPFV